MRSHLRRGLCLRRRRARTSATKGASTRQRMMPICEGSTFYRSAKWTRVPHTSKKLFRLTRSTRRPSPAWRMRYMPNGLVDPLPLTSCRQQLSSREAMQLDPNCGEGYTALGSIETHYEWNWAEAERNLERGVALSPNSSFAEQWMAIYLDAVNRPEEADAVARELNSFHSS